MVNKNGVLTTVYRKPEATASGAALIPPVALPSGGTDDRELLEQKIASTIAYGDNAEGRAQMQLRVLECLSSYSKDTLHFISAAAENTEYPGDLVPLIVFEKRDADYLIDWTVVEPYAYEHDMPPVAKTLSALPYYKGLVPVEGSEYPERRRAQVIAIFRITNHLGYAGVNIRVPDPNDPSGAMEFITDQKLRDLITNHEKPEFIADLMIERKITDAEQLSSILDTMNDTPAAIVEGTL